MLCFHNISQHGFRSEKADPLHEPGRVLGRSGFSAAWLIIINDYLISNGCILNYLFDSGPL
jgi:hypothetical protein